MRLAVPVTADDHAQGPPELPNVLVQYGDYECPYTRRSLRDVEAVRAELGAELRWVFRNFPLTEIHPHALKAAQAADALAHRDGSGRCTRSSSGSRRRWKLENLNRYAAEIGLDTETFAAELAGGLHLVRIRADFDGGARGAEWAARPPSSPMASSTRDPTQDSTFSPPCEPLRRRARTRGCGCCRIVRIANLGEGIKRLARAH